MTEDKPAIAILMAVYEPRLDWLKEQLISLNAQTYSNLRLYVRDECSPTIPFETIQTLVEQIEIVGLRLPEPLFQWAIRLIRSGEL